jgi:peptidoglycan/LPS O-acetylase OafA/YrhL
VWSFLVQFQFFALGSVAFFAARQLDVGWMARHRSIVGPVLTVGGILLLAVFAGWPGVLSPYLPWQGLICALLIVGLHFNAGRLLVNPVSEYLGRISFSFYLAHPLLVYYLIPTYRRIYTAVQDPALSLLACVLVTCAILIPIAEITYRTIEVRGINAGREVTRRLALRWRTQADAAAAI